jgi:D-glycero-D-manno-heptose 1,7-bisphosphate phosphatase
VTKPKNRAVFLDRDGVINEILFHREMGILDTPFTVGQFKLKKNAGKAVRIINRIGFKVIIASNQPGVAMHHFSRKTLEAINFKMIRSLAKQHAHLDGIFYCLHHPEKGCGALKKKCSCRKPKPGLLFQAAKLFNIDLKKSYMIGDSILDVQAGKAAGCKTILIAHLKCDLCHLMAKRGIKPDYLVSDLLAAAKILPGAPAKSR